HSLITMINHRTEQQKNRTRQISLASTRLYCFTHKGAVESLPQSPVRAGERPLVHPVAGKQKSGGMSCKLFKPILP
ncbi:hypothetical protein ACVESR_004845, partial [Enterobacter hormaechei]